MDPGNDKTLLLANAAMAFHFAFEAGKRREALTKLHRIVLLVRGQIATAAAYSSYVADAGLEDGRWRPEIIAIGQALLLRAGETTDAWLQRARELLKPGLVGDSTINQRLRDKAKLDEVLVTATPSALPARAIHSVKGLEFPAVCVVLTTKTAGGIINVLNGASASPKILEEARKIYVAASRAERLLAIATPKSKARNLKAILDVGGSEVTILDI